MRSRGTAVDLYLNWMDQVTFADGDIFTWEKVGPVLPRMEALHAC